MPSQIALIICILIIFYLFWEDRKGTVGVSKAIWLPIIWMLLGGSRYVSQWLNLSSTEFSADSILKGSPVDRFVFTVLIIGGVVVLIRRRLNWKKIFIQNSWIWLFFIFGVISFFWSDYPLVSFKRWIKSLGNVVMVLVILSEHRPYAAFGIILRRFAFILLPLSVLFIKYYPELGRTYHMGIPSVTGVAFQKNGLGQICLLTGTYFSWVLILRRKVKHSYLHNMHYSIYLLILPMIFWLLYKANSATSTVCLITAITIFLVGTHSIMIKNPHRILYFSLALVILFLALEYLFSVKDIILALLGKSQDLTSRVPIWQELRSMAVNPLLGSGFESFWLGERRRIMFEEWGKIEQAHNGYLDMYLHLGMVGLLLIFGWFVSGMNKVRNYLLIDYSTGILRFSLIVIVALYNYTEATFYGVNNIWIIFMLAIMSIPSRNGEPNKE